MSAAAILAAFKGLAVPFTTGAVYWPNDRLVPPDPPALFVWTEVTGLGSNLTGSGTQPLAARPGMIRFHVLIPNGDGIEQAYTAADALSALFAALPNAGGVQGLQTWAPTMPELGASSTDAAGAPDGLWYGVSVSVPWTYWASIGA